MRITIDTALRAVTVEEPSDLKSLSASVLGEGTGPVGGWSSAVVDAAHVWIDISELRGLAGRADDANWQADFDAMIAYARSKGWVDGAKVRAHRA